MSHQLQRNISVRIRETYAILLALGCQLVEVVPTNSKNQDRIEGIMQVYYQACESRCQLLEWLIGSINPYYDQSHAYKNSYDNDPHKHQIKKLSICLWQLGVMPFSKHTKNLDYDKYVEGLLGYQNSVNLIYDLSVLASQKYNNKATSISGAQLLDELIVNKDQLVNTQFDPYGITFPPKYYLKKDIENQKKIIDFNYEEIIGEVETKDDKDDRNLTPNWKEQSEQPYNIFKELQNSKNTFQQKYKSLLQKIIELQPKIRILGLGQATAHQRKEKQIRELHDQRMLKISRQFCKQYTQYKDIILNIHQQQYTHDLDSMKQSLIKQLEGINDIPDVFIT